MDQRWLRPRLQQRAGWPASTGAEPAGSSCFATAWWGRISPASCRTSTRCWPSRRRPQ